MEGLTSAEHYICVRGLNRVYGREIRDFVRVAIVEKTESFGCWRCFVSGENVTLKQLVSYEKIDKSDIP